MTANIAFSLLSYWRKKRRAIRIACGHRLVMYMQGPELDAQNSYKMHSMVESTSIPSPEKEDTGG